ncbi:g8263 [Coccomyxa viridis]|uniref:G8263 protein n=1 Tax=Coccomyxa viridis TaxID=1274662 RepID=A0ABP1FZZ2_9CHLO
MNSVLSLSEEQAAKGVVVHSSGNHAAAVALAAKIHSIPAHIVLPTDAPQCKVDAIRGYGGIITPCAPTMEARESTAAEVEQRTGAAFIPPYNYGPTICGQGTIALEFLQQVPDLDALIVPVSGGGMISGIAVAAKGLKPEIAIIAAEPTGTNGAADTLTSKQAGELVQCERPKTLADGLRGRMGDLTWPIIRDFVDDVIAVSEEQIIDAMQLCFERMKLVVEPSGAVGLAAALTDTFRNHSRFQGKRIGIVLCGGNVDLSALGLWKQLRSAVEQL